MISRKLNEVLHPRTNEAQAALERFEERTRARLQMINVIPLTVLVWGPSLRDSGPITQKRKDIYSALLDAGHNAILSEELSPPSTLGVSLRLYEFAQAQEAHLVVILVEDAAGALGEAEDFAAHPEIAWKVLVMAPSRYQEGYSARGTFKLLEDGFGGMFWYQDDDVQNCNVLTQAMRRAQARREMYALHLIRREAQS